MSNRPDRKHPHEATIWRKGALDFDGNIAFSQPEHIYVRWDYENRLILTADGREERGRATVYFQADVFDIGDYVAEGHLNNASPTQAYEVRNKHKTSNLANTQTEYKGAI